MRFTVLLLALASAFALAADNAVIAPRTAAGIKPQAASLGTEAIAIPQMLSYQGKLTDTLGQPVPNGSYPMMFLLYTTPSGGSSFWSENQSVTVKDGLFSVLLGSVTPIGSLPDAGTVHLAMTVSGGPELTPRIRIVSSAFAYLSGRAASADLLQGKDTTALWNAKALQGKDTTALWNAKTLQGKDTTALDARYVNEGQASSVTSNMIVDGTIVRNDVATNFKAPLSDTADYAKAAPAVDSAAVAGNSHMLQGKDTTALWNAKKLQGRDTTALWNAKTLQGKDTTGFVRTGQVSSITSAMIVANTIVRGNVATNFKAPYADTADYAKAAPALDSARVAGNSYLMETKDTTALWNAKKLQGKDTTALWNAKTLQGKDTTGFVRTGQTGSVTSAMIVDGTIAAVDLGQMGASTGQVMKWTGSTWAPRNDSVGGGGDNAWVRVGSDSVLYTTHYLGIARGGAGNALQTNTQTQVNFGVQCTTGALAATVGGGQGNRAGGQYATVAGGLNNKATSDKATVGGGGPNTAGNTGATVAGGASNSALGTLSTVGGGTGNAARDTGATVGGGVNDTAGTAYSTVGGGLHNVADYGNGATVAGGDSNHSYDLCATVSGGAQNCALWSFGTVGGGRGDTAGSVCSGVLSGKHNVAGNASTDSCAVVAGGFGNRASAQWSTVGGGEYNTAESLSATVGGGKRDTASGRYATVGGGLSNTASGFAATVGGGGSNTASGGYATVGGGSFNTASGWEATVGGGYGDTADADYSLAVGHASVVPAGYTNSAAFNGTRATASNQLCCGTLSKTGGSFTIDDPIDPQNKILNHYFVESPDMSNLYSGSVVLGADGRAEVRLPDYFDALNRNPRVQLTGIGTSDVYVTEKPAGNRFVIGGKPGAEVYWQVTGDRKDQSAEVIRTMMPVEQPKTGSLAGVSWDDNFLAGCMQQLEQMGKAGEFSFRTAAGRQRYENMLKHLREAEQHKVAQSVLPRGERKLLQPPSQSHGLQH